MEENKDFIFAQKAHIIALIAALSVLIAFAGYFYYRNEEKAIRQEKEKELKAIAELKIKQISDWHKDELDDAAVIAKNPFLIAVINKYINGRSEGDRSVLTKHLNQIKAEHGYSDIILASVKGEVFSSTDEALLHVDNSIAKAAQLAVKEKKAISTDIYRCSVHNVTRIDFITAVTDNNNSAVAVMVFKMNPENFLYPLVEFWPTSSKSSETYIARREKDDIIVLNKLRHIDKPALSHKYSINDKESAVVKAVQGYTGFLDARDYRGAKVLAYVSPVRGTSWFMVAKVDRGEIFEESYFKAGTIIAFAVLLILLTAAALLFIYSKRSEQALRESEAGFRSLSQEFHGLLDSIPDSIMLLDKDMKVLWTNIAVAETIAEKPEALIGRFCYALWYERTTPCEPCPVLESFSTGKMQSGIVNRPDGRIWDIRTVPLVDEQGSIARVIEVKRDITEYRRLEEQLRHAQKLEGIGQLAGGIAHDFNNVLNAVVGYAGLLQMKMDKSDSLMHYADEIMAAGHRGAALTRQILAFSRKQVLDMKPVNLNEIVRGLEKMLHRLVREDISIKLELFRKDLVVLADASQIDQVLINFVTNARDAMPKGGQITIETKLVNGSEFGVGSSESGVWSWGARYEITGLRTQYSELPAEACSEPADFAEISVADTGCGMDTETCSYIFEPFFTTKDVGKGTGLGLAVVHGIVKQHGGYINVYSEVGKGTIFKIYLPLLNEESGMANGELTSQSALPVPQAKGETILIAEDEASLRKMSATVLSSYGYKVIEAVDGEDAMLKFTENKDLIKLVILDGIMPRKNGREAFDEIRKLCPDIKAIFVSGYAEDIFAHDGILDKAAVFMQKPLKPDYLLRVVREELDR